MRQGSIWNDIEPVGMRIDEVADLLLVSTATVRNWIKVGHLHTISSRIISKESIDTFMRRSVGTDKLIGRANKLHKKSLGRLASPTVTDKADLVTWKRHEMELSEAYRNKEGIFYTPENIVDDMLLSMDETHGKTFLEPCCGTGNFVMAAIRKGIAPENIYAFDTDAKAIEITRQRVFEATGKECVHIVHGDFLETGSTLPIRFDYIFTNPPWGKKMNKAEKTRYSDKFHTGSSNDTCSLFFFASLSLLREGGRLGFLLPEAFSNIGTFEDARIKALEFHLERLIDYGKPFKGLMTKAHGVILRKNAVRGDERTLCQLPNQRHERLQNSFAMAPKHIFYFSASQETSRTLEYVYAQKHITLKNNAQWALGIVTGNNKEVCKTEWEKGYVPIYRGKDITPDGLLPATLFIDESLSRCQQVAPLSMYRAKEKLVYRFISDKLVFYCDNQQSYLLNSANLLVLNEEFPLSGQQLADLLNSDFMSWLFQTIFATHKVLRSDLETLPIHAGYFSEHKKFDEKSYLAYINLEQDNGTYRIKR